MEVTLYFQSSFDYVIDFSSTYMSDKAVSSRGEIFVPAVGRRDEISSRLAGMKISSCNRKTCSQRNLPFRGDGISSRVGGMKFHPGAEFSI